LACARVIVGSGADAFDDGAGADASDGTDGSDGVSGAAARAPRTALEKAAAATATVAVHRTSAAGLVFLSRFALMVPRYNEVQREYSRGSRAGAEPGPLAPDGRHLTAGQFSWDMRSRFDRDILFAETRGGLICTRDI